MKLEYFIERAAEAMARLRPDLYTNGSAVPTVTNWLLYLADKEDGACIGTGGFLLYKNIDEEGVVTLSLVKSLADIDSSGDEHEVFVWS